MAQLIKLPAENEEVTGSNPGQDNFVIYYNYCLIYPFQFWMVAAMDGCIQCNCKRHPWLHPLTFDKILRPRLQSRRRLRLQGRRLRRRRHQLHLRPRRPSPSESRDELCGNPSVSMTLAGRASRTAPACLPVSRVPTPPSPLPC